MEEYSSATTEALLAKGFFSQPFMQPTISRADNDSHCNYYRPKNSSIPIIIPGGYEGIPQNLLINFVAWMVIII